MEVYEEILDYIRQIPVIDTHEHLVHSEDLLQGRDDVLQEFLIHYMSSDMISSGLDPKVLAIARDSERDLFQRWELIEPYWEFCRHTGYGRALDHSVREIYGIDGIRGSTIEELEEKFKEANKPGHMREVLKDLCNIELAIIDPWTGRFECDKICSGGSGSHKTTLFPCTGIRYGGMAGGDLRRRNKIAQRLA